MTGNFFRGAFFGGGFFGFIGGGGKGRGKGRVSYKKPPTFAEAYMAEAKLAEMSRIEAEATRLSLESVPIEEADEDDLSDEVLMALTVRLLH